MQNFKITNIHIGETYGGVLCYENLRELNQRFVDEMEESVAVCFGDERKIYRDIEQLDLDKRLPKYFFIAWLANENEKNICDKTGDEYHGFHLFVAGYEEDLDNVITRVREIGEERFHTESVGFFF